MDEQGFRNMLQSLGLREAEIMTSVALAYRFERYLNQPGRDRSAQSAWEFSRLLIGEGSNTEANYLSLARYCRFTGDNEMFVALLELVDGGEVGERLYRMIKERFGRAVRDEVFAGIGVAPYGTPSPEKPAFVQPVIRSLHHRVGAEACMEFLSACLRELPEKHFFRDRDRFRKAADIDDFLRQRKASFIGELEQCQREHRLFYAQEITPEVLDFVRSDPEIGAGRRDGDILYETKIPYMTKQYLASTDPILKRYYACHCPWAREAIKNGGVKLDETFCYCSGGFHKKPWEVIFGQQLKVEVLESAIRGDVRCRFAIHLPAEALGKQAASHGAAQAH